MCCWAKHLTFLGRSFLICKMTRLNKMIASFLLAQTVKTLWLVTSVSSLSLPVQAHFSFLTVLVSPVYSDLLSWKSCGKKEVWFNLAWLKKSHCSICSWSGMDRVIYWRCYEERKGNGIKVHLHLLVGSRYKMMAMVITVNT